MKTFISETPEVSVVTHPVVLRRGPALLLLLVVSACAGVPQDNGRKSVDELIAARGVTVDDATPELLSSLTSAPLTRESAVRIALINNPGLQATYASLGFGAADVYEAGRIRNPVFSGAALNSNAAGEGTQVSLGLVTSFTDLLTLPARKRLSLGSFAALQQSVGAEVLSVAAQAEAAYFVYVGAQQVAALRAQTAKAAGLSATLAGRYRDAGNITPRELALEKSAASEARLIALDAEAAAYAARTALASVMGLSVGDTWTAPAELSLPLATEAELDALLVLARQSRLDLASARTRADVLADRLGVVNWTRWLGELDIGIEREREVDGARITGPTLDWEVPIFNQHKDAVTRADAELQIAITDVRRVATDVENGVRLAHAALQIARARIAEYRDVLIPQRVETVARAQEEVNFMLIGIFELIALKQDEYAAYEGYLDAIRDYWIARAELGLAVGAELPDSARADDTRIGVDEFLRPAPGGMDHSAHGGTAEKSPEADSEQTPAGMTDHSMHNMNQRKQDEPSSGDHTGHDMNDAGGSDALDEGDDREHDHDNEGGEL